MHDAPGEADLVARIAAGDQAALEALATAYHARLWRYLSRQLDQHADWVEDALQEIWLAVWRSARHYRGAARVSAWIFQIAHHQMIDLRQTRQRYAAHEQPTDAQEDASFDLAMPSHEAAVLDRLALAGAMRQLPPKHQEALELVCGQGFTIDEAARILGVPSGTVKSRLSYARRALLAALRKGAIS